MRPLDALTRHASSWGRLVTISVFAVLTAGLVMAVWWAATTEERTAPTSCAARQRHHARPRRRRRRRSSAAAPRRRSQVHRTDRFAFGHPAEPSATSRGGTLACARAARPRCSAAARPPTACACPTTCRSRSGPLGRRRFQRLPRLGAGRHRHGRRRTSPASAASRSSARSRVGRRRARPPPARPSAWSCARARAACDARRAARPLPRRRRDRPGPPQRPRRHVADDAPFQVQALSTQRRRGAGGGPMSAAARGAPALARRLRRASGARATSSLSLPLGLVCARSPWCSCSAPRSARLDRPADRARRGRRLLAPRARSTAARPTGCSTRTSRRCPPAAHDGHDVAPRAGRR